MNRRLRKFFPVLPLALLTGCLEFGKQTMSYRYDKATDTLCIFQDYHGIFGEDAKGKPGEGLSAQEREQLESVLKGQRTFFFSNWVFEYDREKLEEQLHELKIPEKRAALKLPESGLASLEKLVKLLHENVRVENGPFYFDARKKLCGVQYVTVTRCSAVIAAANEFAPHFIKAQTEEEDFPEEEKTVGLKFASSPLSVVQLEGNALSVRWPMSRRSYDQDFGPSAKDTAKLTEVREAGLNYSFADDVVTWKLGKPADAVTSLTLSFSTNTYVPNLLEPAKRLHTIRETFDARAAADDFLLRSHKTSAATR
jgi:hypothetical protein